MALGVSHPTAVSEGTHGTLASWNCRDVQFFIGELSFDQLAPDRLKAPSAVLVSRFLKIKWMQSSPPVACIGGFWLV